MKSSIRNFSSRLAVIALFVSICSAGVFSARAFAGPSRAAVPVVRENATSDEQGSQDALRHAAHVQWLANHLHIRVETAAKAFEDVNSGILILVIAYYLVKGLPKAFRKRRETIQVALTDARSATEQANERLSAVEERLSRLDTEIEAIRQQAERDVLHDEERIKQALEDERRRIVEAAQHEIDSAGVAAQRRLKQFAAELAIERATHDLHLTPETDRLLVSDFGKSLNTDLGRGRSN